jgi:hypothetical protein
MARQARCRGESTRRGFCASLRINGSALKPWRLLLARRVSALCAASLNHQAPHLALSNRNQRAPVVNMRLLSAHARRIRPAVACAPNYAAMKALISRPRFVNNGARRSRALFSIQRACRHLGLVTVTGYKSGAVTRTSCN